MVDSVHEASEELFGKVLEAGKFFVKAMGGTMDKSVEIEKNVIMCGMGGSGIAADYIKLLHSQVDSKNIVINKNYDIPASVNNNWTSIVTSYSGNTEETLNCFHQLVERGCKPVCISSGGKLKQLAEEHNLLYIEVASGIPPRAAFPLLFGSIYGLLAYTLKLDIPNEEERDAIVKDAETISIEQIEAISPNLLEKFPVIVFPKDLTALGIRFRCQLNENSKMPAGDYEIPEFSHNAIVGFDGHMADNQAMVLLRSQFEHQRTAIHLDFMRDQLTQAGYTAEFKTDSMSRLRELLRLTWELDYISIMLAKLQSINPVDVRSIDKLKSVLRSKK